MSAIYSAIIVVSGDMNAKLDAIKLLEAHSRANSPKSTYAYYFTAYREAEVENKLLNLPEELKSVADHFDELFYVFGMPYLTPDAEGPYAGKRMK